MTINRIGYHFIHNASFSINRPEGSGDYLLLILKSPSQVLLHNQKYNLPSGTFLFYKKDTPQFYKASEGEFINDWIHINPTEDEVLELKKLDIPFDKPVTLSDSSDLSDLIRALCYTFYGNGMHREESMQLYLRLIFIKLSEKLHYQSDKNYGNHYENIMLLRSSIYNMPYSEWTIDDMAQRVNMSRSYFQHTYKEITGLSPIDDVIQSRIEHAKHLLSSTNASVLSVSEQCGYACQQHFLRQFKKIVGCTPKEYRKK